MNIPLLVLLSAAATHAPDNAIPGFSRAAARLQEALDGRQSLPPVVRGQSPYGAEPLYTPGVDGGTTTLYPPTYAPEGTSTYPGDSALSAPLVTPQPYYYPGAGSADPWLGNQGVTPVPYGPSPYGGMNVPQGFYTYGMNGPQPYRYGLQERVNLAWLPASGTTPNLGDFEIFELDLEKSLVSPLWYNWVFTATPQFNYRSWEGPRGLAGVAHLPGSVYRIGMNFQLATPSVNGWSAEVGFNPALATDFQADIDWDAVLLDAYGVAFWQWGPQWTWALGALYWDRVDDIILPYAGVVYAPNDYWEFRLVFPQPRVSYFLGTPWGVATWVYVGGEYHVEAYYIDPEVAGAVDRRVQYSDWRVYGGIRCEAGQYTTFAEAGAAIDREIKLEKVTPDLEIDSGFFARIGLRW